MKKICLHYALSASSAKDGCTTGSRTFHILWRMLHISNSSTSLFFHICVLFFFFSCKVVKILSKISDRSQPTFDSVSLVPIQPIPPPLSWTGELVLMEHVKKQFYISCLKYSRRPFTNHDQERK